MEDRDLKYDLRVIFEFPITSLNDIEQKVEEFCSKIDDMSSQTINKVKEYVQEQIALENFDRIDGNNFIDWIGTAQYNLPGREFRLSHFQDRLDPLSDIAGSASSPDLVLEDDLDVDFESDEGSLDNSLEPPDMESLGAQGVATGTSLWALYLANKQTENSSLFDTIPEEEHTGRTPKPSAWEPSLTKISLMMQIAIIRVQAASWRILSNPPVLISPSIAILSNIIKRVNKKSTQTAFEKLIDIQNNKKLSLQKACKIVMVQERIRAAVSFAEWRAVMKPRRKVEYLERIAFCLQMAYRRVVSQGIRQVSTYAHKADHEENVALWEKRIEQTKILYDKKISSGTRLLATIIQKILNKEMSESFSKITIMKSTMNASRVWTNMTKNIRYLLKQAWNQWMQRVFVGKTCDWKYFFTNTGIVQPILSAYAKLLVRSQFKAFNTWRRNSSIKFMLIRSRVIIFKALINKVLQASLRSRFDKLKNFKQHNCIYNQFVSYLRYRSRPYGQVSPFQNPIYPAINTLVILPYSHCQAYGDSLVENFISLSGRQTMRSARFPLAIDPRFDSIPSILAGIVDIFYARRTRYRRYYDESVSRSPFNRVHMAGKAKPKLFMPDSASKKSLEDSFEMEE